MKEMQALALMREALRLLDEVEAILPACHLQFAIDILESFQQGAKPGDSSAPQCA